MKRQTITMSVKDARPEKNGDDERKYSFCVKKMCVCCGIRVNSRILGIAKLTGRFLSVWL